MGLPAVERLRAAALAHLRARIAEPLEAPKDWRRNSQLPCSCPDCRDLAQFLDDPAQKTWTLKAAEARRGHVEAVIRQAGSDLDVATDRKGRPYTLSAPKIRRVMSGGSNSASEIWKPWRGWKLEPAACVLRTAVQIATGGRGKSRWLRAPATKLAR
jgi:hypothetical protein